MKVGTKSILFGAHCFFIHPLYVALAWWKLYGFPWDPRLWVAFFVHDLGYWGKPNMDGAEGELHPYFGAKIMRALFGEQWYEFTLYHSRFLAKKNGAKFSRLCVADKYAFALTPCWLYIPMAVATGEIHEYMKDAERNNDGQVKSTGEYKIWKKAVEKYMAVWIAEHKDLKDDTWTPDVRKSINKDGVWR